MFIELNPDGSVKNTFNDTDPDRRGEWYPDDTHISQMMFNGEKTTRVSPENNDVNPGWASRAGRVYNAQVGAWVPVGAPITESPEELAHRRMREQAYLDDTKRAVADIDRRLRKLE